jgi:hypothetical protein
MIEQRKETKGHVSVVSKKRDVVSPSVISIVCANPRQPQIIDGLRLPGFHAGLEWAGICLTPTCYGLVVILLTARIGGFQPLPHVLKGGSVDLAARIALA